MPKKVSPQKKLSMKEWGFEGGGKRKAKGSDYAPEDQHSSRLLCTVSGTRARFMAADESFAIWTAVVEEGGQGHDVVISGPLARVSSGEMLQCAGRWKKHPKHGWSFQVQQYRSALPTNASGVAAWLQTRVDGVGPTFAEAIVEHFGQENVFDTLDKDPALLRQVKTKKGRALPAAQVDKAIEAWDGAKAIRQIEAFLFSHGVSANLADKLYRAYGEDVVEIMQTEPYRITELRGIGFKIADRVALSMGIAKDAPERLEAGIIYVLEEAEGDGHVFLGLEALVGRSMDSLGVDKQKPLVDAASRLAADGKIVAEADEALSQRVYLRRWHKIECRMARAVRERLRSPGEPLYSKPTRPLAPEGATAEEIDALRLPTDEQWEVLEDVRSQKLTILSGNPGVGKCLHGESEVFVNGETEQIELIWQKYSSAETTDGKGYWSIPNQDLFVPSINEKKEIVNRPVKHIYRQRVKESGRKLTLSNGNKITMTKRHRLLGPLDWTRDFSVGDFVYSPSFLPQPEGAAELEREYTRQAALVISKKIEDAPKSFVGEIPRDIMKSNQESVESFLTYLTSFLGEKVHSPLLYSSREITRDLSLLLKRFGLVGERVAVNSFFAVKLDNNTRNILKSAEGPSSALLTNQTAEDNCWVQITKVEEVMLDGWVYDFEIDEDHNYLAEGVQTHNTQTVNEIVRLAKEHNLRLELCAPTGKAARRMAELTKTEAKTIHRLLEFSPWDGGFQRNEENPLVADLVVVDEASMLSLDLADSLFRALSDKTHILLVGDPDQLPPVGVGKVLDDMIQSGAVPRVHLSKIFRQAARSMIIQNSRRINSGKLPYLAQAEAEESLGQKMLNDFYWVTRREPKETLKLTLEMVTTRIPRTFKFDPKTEIMVLAPMRKGVVGLEVLNQELEDALNAPEEGAEKVLVVPRRGIYVGSRIVQTKNSYDEHHYVMNGEIAIVLDYKKESGEALLQLDDGEREIWVPAADMDSYMLAWAMSIHRAQGSQWPCVVAPVSSSFYIMLSRSLVYTAVTRASKLCIMTGEKKAISMAVDKIDNRRRNSTLAARILDPSLSGELF